MKKLIEYSFITLIFFLSIFYTNKITNIVKKKDPIMKTILDIKDIKKIESVNAIINDDEIIPGKNGCEVDEDKSYAKMKKINQYNESMLKYKDVIPEITINNLYNKYISSGNSKDRNVSIVLYIEDDIIKVNDIKDIKLNVFLDSNILSNGKVEITENKRIYNGGNNKNYDDIVIEWVNDVINTNYNDSSYCLNLDKKDDNLLVCSRNKMHSISPKLLLNKNNMYDIKANINNGSIIYVDEKNIDNIKYISDYIIKKGFNIVYLEELLDEKQC